METSSGSKETPFSTVPHSPHRFESPVRLLVFADDWGRHPSSCQHLVRELLPRIPTLWVNTIGTRKPRLDMTTLRRGWEKLSRKGKRGAPPPTDSTAEAAPQVLNPLMWPYFSRARDRWLNRQLLTRQLSRHLPKNENVIALTTLPITADLVGELPVAKWVYYCVDDFSQWPGLDGKTLERMERKLVEHVETVVAASVVLQNRLAKLGRPDAHLLTHGVDLEHWQRVPQQGEGDVLWPELPRPLFVFWGLIDRRLDTEWLTALSAAMASGTIVLVGPTQDPDPRLRNLPRVALRPAMPFADLPELADSAAALIMPYADLPVTRAMQPLKMLEYLATMKPVIVRDLPAVGQWREALDACATADDFVAKVLLRAGHPLPTPQQQARERLAAESWRAKAEQLERWLLAPPLFSTGLKFC